jgi:hypothetical protein
MNPRERLLAVAIGGVMVAIFGYLGLSYVSGQFTTRNNEISRLEGEIKKRKQQVFAGQVATKKISEYETRSLPPDVQVTRTQYQDWLLNEIQKAGLTKPDVAFKVQMPEGDLLVRQSFTASAKGTLPQIVDLLYAFYSVDWLHRVTQLRLRPVKDSKLLEVTLSIEALSLRKAKEAPQLEPRPGKRLALADRDAYRKAIADRNLFGPPNNAPKISITGSKDVYLGRTADLTVKGTDPDTYDKVRFRLVESPDPTAQFDEEKGRLTWSPKEKGKYEFVFEGIDDGLPNKRSNLEKVVINVTEQPPSGPKRLDFDHARFTILSAVIDLDGKGEIWLYVRPLGQTVRLHEGEDFEIGSVKGTVTQIGAYDFSFKSDGKLRKLTKGDVLDQAQVVADLSPTGTVEAADSNTKNPPPESQIQLTAEDNKAG